MPRSEAPSAKTGAAARDAAVLERLEKIETLVSGSLIAMKARLVEIHDALGPLEELRARAAATPAAAPSESADGSEVLARLAALETTITRELEELRRGVSKKSSAGAAAAVDPEAIAASVRPAVEALRAHVVADVRLALGEERQAAETRASSVRVPLVELTRRLDQAMETVRALEGLREEVERSSKTVGSTVAARAEKSFRRLEESIGEVRTRLEQLETGRTPDGDQDATVAALRAEISSAFAELRGDVATMTDDLHAEVVEMGADLRGEPGERVDAPAVRPSAPAPDADAVARALEEIRGIAHDIEERTDRLAPTIAERTDAVLADRLQSLGAIEPGAASAPPIDVDHLAEVIAARVLAIVEARLPHAPASEPADSGFLSSFGTTAEEEPRGWLGRLRRRHDVGHVVEPVASRLPTAPIKMRDEEPLAPFMPLESTPSNDDADSVVEGAHESDDARDDAHATPKKDDQSPPTPRKRTASTAASATKKRASGTRATAKRPAKPSDKA